MSSRELKPITHSPPPPPAPLNEAVITSALVNPTTTAATSLDPTNPCEIDLEGDSIISNNSFCAQSPGSSSGPNHSLVSPYSRLGLRTSASQQECLVVTKRMPASLQARYAAASPQESPTATAKEREGGRQVPFSERPPPALPSASSTPSSAQEEPACAEGVHQPPPSPPSAFVSATPKVRKLRARTSIDKSVATSGGAGGAMRGGNRSSGSISHPSPTQSRTKEKDSAAGVPSAGSVPKTGMSAARYTFRPPDVMPTADGSQPPPRTQRHVSLPLPAAAMASAALHCSPPRQHSAQRGPRSSRGSLDALPTDGRGRKVSADFHHPLTTSTPTTLPTNGSEKVPPPPPQQQQQQPTRESPMESRDTPPVNYHMPRGFSQQGVYYHTSDSYRRSSEGVGRNGGEDASSNVRSSSSAVTGVRPAPPRTVRIGPPPGLSYAVRNGGGAGRHPLPPVAQGRRPTSGSTAALQWTPMPTLSPSQRREPRLLKQLFPSKFSAVPRGSVSSVATTTSSSGSSSRRSTVTDAPPVANTASAENPVVTSSPRTSERQSAPSPATCTTPLTVTVVDATASASGDSALAWTASPLGERPGAPSPHFTAPLALSSTLGEASRSASPPAALTETEEAAAAKKAYLHQTSVPRLLDELTVSLAEQQPEHPIDHLLHLLRQRRATLSSESAPAQKQSTPTP